LRRETRSSTDYKEIRRGLRKKQSQKEYRSTT
jgi:hypothetical protein